MIERFQNRKKLQLFAIMGAGGGFAGALVGELILLLLVPAAPPPPSQSAQVDVLFLLDVTSSMQPQIDGVRKGIAAFSEALSGKKLDSRIGLIAYRDRLIGEEPRVLQFKNGPFSSDAADFRGLLGELQAEGGGDIPESSLDAVVLGTQQVFRQSATRVMVLITDAPPLIPDKATQSVGEATAALRQHHIDQVHLVINHDDQGIYEALQGPSPGEVFLLGDIAGGSSNFDRLLPVVGDRIAERTLRGLQSNSEFAPHSFWRIVLVAILWTGVIAVGIGLALISGQNIYLRRHFLSRSEFVAGLLGGLVAGGIAGGCGQLLFSGALSFAALEAVGRITAWGVLGILLGYGTAQFVPNLLPRFAAMGGGVGGAFAAMAFMASSSLVGDAIGRLWGAAILGAFIGVMVALIESVTRAIWLEVRFGDREVVNVSLGMTPVTIGSDNRKSTIYARNSRPLAFRFQVEDGKVTCTDYSTESTTAVGVGHHLQIGTLGVTVRSGDGEKIQLSSNGPVSMKAVPPPPPPAKPGPRGKSQLAQEPQPSNANLTVTPEPRSSTVRTTSPPPPPPPPPSPR